VLTAWPHGEQLVQVCVAGWGRGGQRRSPQLQPNPVAAAAGAGAAAPTITITTTTTHLLLLLP
jgi:hypothetical protein